MTRKYLLSIDGGGLRGIIPLSALIKLEQTTGRLSRDTFSFVAGTSTGAVIAAAIAAGIPATRIYDLYLRFARDIFKGPLTLPRRVLFGAMYSTEKLNEVLADGLGVARNWTLNQSPIDILITAKRVSDGMPWYFVRDKPTNSGRTGSLRILDCVTASTAAPTYFKPWTIPTIGALVDGGVGVAGNPVYQACVEAFYYTDEYQPDETLIVSMGTGRFLTEKNPTWIWAWLEWLLGELLRSPGEQQTEIVQRHFTETPFYRLDPALHRNISLDDVRAIPELRRLGDQFAARIDWEAILAGTDTTFRIKPAKTLYQQYREPVHEPSGAVVR
jgi:uncharacterized protein